MDTLGKRLCYIIVVTSVCGIGQSSIGTGDALHLRRHAPAYPDPHGTIRKSYSQLYQHAEWCTSTAQTEQDTPQTRSDDQGWRIRLRVFQLSPGNEDAWLQGDCAPMGSRHQRRDRRPGQLTDPFSNGVAGQRSWLSAPRRFCGLPRDSGYVVEGRDSRAGGHNSLVKKALWAN